MEFKTFTLQFVEQYRQMRKQKSRASEREREKSKDAQDLASFFPQRRAHTRCHCRAQAMYGELQRVAGLGSRGLKSQRVVF